MSSDVFIVGGGPAGLAAAIALRRRGFSVTVSDVAVPPADKACGEGLLPDAAAALADLGVQIGYAESFTLRGIRFVDRATSVAADFPATPGRGVRRTILHRAMVDHAELIGIKLRWGTHVDLPALRCGWIVAADGQNSAVRKWAGLDGRVHDRTRFGFRRHYKIAPWSEFVEIYWGDAYQVYVTPTSYDSLCVATISGDSRFRLDDAIRGLPELARRLNPGEIITAERGGITASRKLKAVYSNRVALVGDASGSVDAITAEGLSVAFRQAPALAEAIEHGDLSEYQRKHRQIRRRPVWMARLLLTLGDHSCLRSAAMRAMSAYPRIFAKMLAVHVGHYRSQSR